MTIACHLSPGEKEGLPWLGKGSRPHFSGIPLICGTRCPSIGALPPVGGGGGDGGGGRRDNWNQSQALHTTLLFSGPGKC